MYAVANVLKYRETEHGTDLVIHLPNKLKDCIEDKHIRVIECRFDDGRHISAEQRKKCYAMFNDISEYTGDVPEAVKEYLKVLHISNTGCEYFSLSNCSMDRAREFINTIIEFVLENGIQLTDLCINRTDDIGKYLWYCLKHKKCAVCGKQGEIHHADTIGMGNDRTKVDDSNYRKLCLCREHHTIAHSRGMETFEKMYKVYGIIFKEDVA